MAAGADPKASTLRWRERALDLVLWAGVGIGTVPLVVIFVAAPDFLPTGLRYFGLGVYLLVSAVALARRVPHQVRVWTFLLALFALAGVALATRGLGGGGRLFLVVLPIFATVLLGTRSGYAAAAMSLALYTTAAFLNVGGFLKPWNLLPGNPSAPQVWLLQGAMLVLVTVPVLVLVSRFVDLLQGALTAERVATERIVEAGRERRCLERALLETGERERRAVGHQLHDGPCQQITAALLRCKVAQNALIARGAGEEAAQIAAIAEVLDASVAEIHDLALGLSPAKFSPGALAAALDELARSVRASGAVACEFLHDGSAQPTDPEATSQLFRIAQEAVRNAVRHARPGHIRIEFERSAGVLRLQVRDDGIGMPRDGGRDGMGLRIMRFRTELVGGSLSVGPAAGGGTLVTCAVPLSSPAASRKRGA